MNLNPKTVLNHVFGYADFRKDQAEIVERLISGHDALVLMPTGGGKSLCYQIPAMILDGVGIVISPLIALMQDQVDALLQVGVKAAFLNSSLEEYNHRTVFGQSKTADLFEFASHSVRLVCRFSIGRH